MYQLPITQLGIGVIGNLHVYAVFYLRTIEQLFYDHNIISININHDSHLLLKYIFIFFISLIRIIIWCKKKKIENNTIEKTQFPYVLYPFFERV